MVSCILTLLVLLHLCCPSLTLSVSFTRGVQSVSSFSKKLHFRGGGGEQQPQQQEQQEVVGTTKEQFSPVIMTSSFLSPLGNFYAGSLKQNPILTKSVTACFIFGLSDYLAQKLESSSSSNEGDEGKSSSNISLKRIMASAVVGFGYFGPAAHAWYEMIFRVFPGTGLFSTLQKAAMGQLFFGPSFTCIFFASALLQSGEFTVGNWISKIRNDLPRAWVAGLGFWPLVDLISYSMVPPQYIPLFVNMCSLFWTIYLSLIANKSQKQPDPKKS